MLSFEYHAYICRRSSAVLSVTPVKHGCESNRHFCKVESSTYGEINERNFGTLTRSGRIYVRGRYKDNELI